MIRVCEDCRIAVVRKRVHDPETRGVRVVTSIWVFSDDNTIRMELRMEDDQMYIPYSSYFSPTKVSITVPCELKFHDVKHGNRPAKIAKTSWVNYVFETPQGINSLHDLRDRADVIHQPLRCSKMSSWAAHSWLLSEQKRRCASTRVSENRSLTPSKCVA
jgi:hypothetical protein